MSVFDEPNHLSKNIDYTDEEIKDFQVGRSSPFSFVNPNNKQQVAKLDDQKVRANCESFGICWE